MWTVTLQNHSLLSSHCLVCKITESCQNTSMTFKTRNAAYYHPPNHHKAKDIELIYLLCLLYYLETLKVFLKISHFTYFRLIDINKETFRCSLRKNIFCSIAWISNAWFLSWPITKTVHFVTLTFWMKRNAPPSSVRAKCIEYYNVYRLHMIYHPILWNIYLRENNVLREWWMGRLSVNSINFSNMNNHPTNTIQIIPFRWSRFCFIFLSL